MPTISVNRNFQTYRATVTPSTLLSDVLKDACQHFQLGSDVSGYSLVNINGKVIDLSLPFRFSNLAQGANLDLKGPIDIKTSNSNVITNDTSIQNEKFVNIRISVSSTKINTTIMEKFPNKNTFQDVLKVVKEKCGLTPIPNDRFSVQVMMKIIKPNEFDKPLASLGLTEGNHAIRLRVLPENQLPPTHTVQTLNPKKIVTEEKVAVKTKTPTENLQPQETKDEDIVMHSTEEENYNVEIQEKKEEAEEKEGENVVIPEEEPAKTNISFIQSKTNVKEYDDSSYEMSVEQARVYQKILSQRAADQPMLTRALREKIEAEERQRKEQIKKSIYKGECLIRIKFPDNKVIQIKIDNRKSLKDLGDVLIDEVLKPDIIPSQYIKGGELFFELYIALPYKKILGKGIDLEKKIDDCEFGNRISLLFRFETDYTRTVTTGYILDDLLEKTEEPTEAINSTELRTNGESVVQDSVKEDSNSVKRAKFKKVPAWMKLSKK
ncbi:hypothetical protein C6P40_002731 [Pichia californica]|uniref:UBX domain-containing protein n=1 Tax=Pichia californica TaxID=460514 RepID=A0A9P6WNS1_9ASCO|nr:hypothetical protein C6P42_003875 [[Candida] californica]KAG0690486.1 hypothetical protein C6P40_002731 [[Candida] californica]